jgi:hypothetical protein
MDAEKDAQRMQYDLAVFAAWHVEAFARTKKLPDLGSLLARKSPAAQASDVTSKIKAVMGMFPRAAKADSG